jgi:hypothetical protein
VHAANLARPLALPCDECGPSFVIRYRSRPGVYCT